jgi:uncharacterized membrane protein
MFKKILDIFKNNFLKIDKVLFSIIAIGFLLRAFHLGRESIWVDEGFTYRLAKFTLPQYIENVLGTLRNILPPLYFQIMHFWSGIFGNSEFSLRFPSVIFGTLSILLMYFFAKNIFNKEVGLISSILLSISLFHMQYSQEARMYEMLSFF